MKYKRVGKNKYKKSWIDVDWQLTIFVTVFVVFVSVVCFICDHFGL